MFQNDLTEKLPCQTCEKRGGCPILAGFEKVPRETLRHLSTMRFRCDAEQPSIAEKERRATVAKDDGLASFEKLYAWILTLPLPPDQRAVGLTLLSMGLRYTNSQLEQLLAER